MQQSSFFDTKRLLDDEFGQLTLIRQFMEPQVAQVFFDKLRKEICWQQDKIPIAGKLRTIPRLQAWYGKPGANYTYSGLSLEPRPWTPTLLQLKKLVEQQCTTSFNSVLLNLYRHGQDSMGWHSDNEPELGEQPTIASLSLGAGRYFSLRQKAQGCEKMKILLDSGSLLVMAGKLQSFWQHQVPKTARPVGERINLTFRFVQV